MSETFCMPLYEYQGKTKNGKDVFGVVVAETPELAKDVLRERSLAAIELAERASPGIWALSFSFLRRVPAKALVIFSRQLSVMIAAGVPLVKALRSLTAQTEHPRLRAILEEVAADIDGGSRLSDAMAAHPIVFSPFTVNMIRSGETTGRLAQVLEYLADQEEKDYDLRSKIRGAMMYPAFVLSGMAVLGFLMMTFVIPKLTGTLQETGVALPITTKILISVSDFFVRFWYVMIALAAFAVAGIRVGIRTPVGRRIWDTLKLRLPIFGNLFRHIIIVRMTRSMETLLAGGVDTVTALGAVAEIVSNAVYRDLLLETKAEVEDGNSLTTVFSTTPQVPTMLTQMLAVGEETGALQEVLRRLSGFYGREVENLVAGMVTLIEPVIMVVMGVAVGVMVSAIILPMYSLASAF
jgi:type II secretory pathway component PulF